jgi:hypothetical protein
MKKIVPVIITLGRRALTLLLEMGMGGKKDWGPACACCCLAAFACVHARVCVRMSVCVCASVCLRVYACRSVAV